jgi:hypothetical protein
MRIIFCYWKINISEPVIFPVTCNILLINYFLTPDNLPLDIVVCRESIFLIFVHWENYKGLFKID